MSPRSLPGLQRAELIPDLVHQSIDGFFGRQLVRRLGHSPVEAQPPELFVVRRDDEDLLVRMPMMPCGEASPKYCLLISVFE